MPRRLALRWRGLYACHRPCRLRGQRVNELLRGGSPTEALELLSVDPKLAWVKDSQTGGYPVHIAAWKVSGWRRMGPMPGPTIQYTGGMAHAQQAP